MAAFWCWCLTSFIMRCPLFATQWPACSCIVRSASFAGLQLQFKDEWRWEMMKNSHAFWIEGSVLTSSYWRSEIILRSQYDIVIECRKETPYYLSHEALSSSGNFNGYQVPSTEKHTFVGDWNCFVLTDTNLTAMLIIKGRQLRWTLFTCTLMTLRGICNAASKTFLQLNRCDSDYLILYTIPLSTQLGDDRQIIYNGIIEVVSHIIYISYLGWWFATVFELLQCRNGDH